MTNAAHRGCWSLFVRFDDPRIMVRALKDGLSRCRRRTHSCPMENAAQRPIYRPRPTSEEVLDIFVNGRTPDSGNRSRNEPCHVLAKVKGE